VAGVTRVLKDSHQRRINYLRLSVTDRCNLKCSYCMPAEGLPIVSRDELLTSEEIMCIARVAVQLGIRKIRVTGGEPMVRPDILELLRELGSLPELELLVLTTNGLRLGKMAADLADAGVSGANISIDSLEPDRYRDITRGGDLKKCLEGIDASINAGLRTKINVVVMAGVNDHEASAFVDFVRTRPVTVRFIEYMPTRGRDKGPSLTVPTSELLDRLNQYAPLEPIERSGGLTMAGPARNFRVPGALGSVGVISPVSCHFCEDCNRIRVTSTGLARGCLFHETGLDLKPWLRAGDEEGLARAMTQVVDDKPEKHQLDEDEGPDPIQMSQIGG
jgi:GTP 3',8-cyclase